MRRTTAWFLAEPQPPLQPAHLLSQPRSGVGPRCCSFGHCSSPRSLSRSSLCRCVADSRSALSLSRRSCCVGLPLSRSVTCRSSREVPVLAGCSSSRFLVLCSLWCSQLALAPRKSCW